MEKKQLLQKERKRMNYMLPSLQWVELVVDVVTEEKTAILLEYGSVTMISADVGTIHSTRVTNKLVSTSARLAVTMATEEVPHMYMMMRCSNYIVRSITMSKRHRPMSCDKNTIVT